MQDKEENIHLNYTALYEELKKEKSSTCYPIPMLQAFYDGELDEIKKADAGNHIRGCDACTAELEYLKLFHASNLESAEYEKDLRAIKKSLHAQLNNLLGNQLAPKETVPWYVKVLSPLVDTKWIAAMSAAAVLIAGLLFFTPKEPQVPNLDNGVSSRNLVRGDLLILESPLGDLESQPRSLSWTKVPGAATYSVKITEVDSNVILTTFSSSNKLDLPTEIQSKLIADKTYYWYVEARSEKGIPIRRSTRGIFKIRRG